MFAWLPIIGPIIQGVVSIFNKFQDVKIVQYQTDADKYKAGAEASSQIIQATEHDYGVQLTRDLVIFPVGVWTALISWDTIIALRYPDLMFHVAPYPQSLSFLPYAVLTFLLGTVAVTSWKR
jgi:hypothetical protein